MSIFDFGKYKKTVVCLENKMTSEAEVSLSATIRNYSPLITWQVREIHCIDIQGYSSWDTVYTEQFSIYKEARQEYLRRKKQI